MISFFKSRDFIVGCYCRKCQL